MPLPIDEDFPFKVDSFEDVPLRSIVCSRISQFRPKIFLFPIYLKLIIPSKENLLIPEGEKIL